MNEQIQASLPVKKPHSRELTIEALNIAITNVSLDSKMIRALRLTCKRTKVAADAQVTQFTINNGQDPVAVQRSGLLNNVRKLVIMFTMMQWGLNIPTNLEELLRAVGLLKLAVDVCSSSLDVLELKLDAHPNVRLACALALTEHRWDVLHELSLTRCMPGFLSAILSKPGSFPALKALCCQEPNAADLELLSKSTFVGSLTTLSIEWPFNAYNSNRAPETVAAMRNVLHKATNVENLHLTSSAFEFFDVEPFNSLRSIKSLHLGVPLFGKAELHHPIMDSVDLAPALARPWIRLESLSIKGAYLIGPEVKRIFEAGDTLLGLQKLVIKDCSFDISVQGALSQVYRHHLKEIWVCSSRDDYLLISALARVMKADTHNTLPRLQDFHIYCADSDIQEDPLAFAIIALSEFLSCPSVKALESLSIHKADVFAEGIELVYNIVNNCPKLKYLDLRGNDIGRPGVALLLGNGQLGAWPELEKLGILEKRALEYDSDEYDANSLNSKHPYMPKVKVQTALRRAWPGLECF